MNSRTIKLAAAATAGAVVAVWLGGSLYVSSRIAAEMKAFAARPPLETGLRILDLNHTNGLFSSSGTFKVQPYIQDSQMSVADTPTAEVSYAVSNILLPTSVARVTWTMKPSGEADEALTKLLGTPLIIQGNGKLTFSGGIDTTLSIPELAINEDGVRVNVTPSSGRFAIDRTTLAFGWTLDKVVSRGKGEAMELNKLAVEVNVKDRAQGLGTSTLSLDKISTTSGVAEGFRHVTEVTRAGDRLDIRSSDKLRSATFSGQALNDLTLELAVTGLDAASMQRLVTVLSESNALQNLTAEEEAHFRQDLRTLIAQGFTVGIPKISGTVAKGSVNGTMSVELRKSTSPNAPVALASLLNASGDLLVKGEALPQQQAEMAVASGFVQTVPDGLKADFSYTDGILRANGRIFDAEQVQMALSEIDQTINAFLDTPRVASAAAPISPPAPQDNAADTPSTEEEPSPPSSLMAATPIRPTVERELAVAPAPGATGSVAARTECADIDQCVLLSLKAAAREDIDSLRAVASRIEALAKPDLGNKAVARKLNTEGLEALKRGDADQAADLFNRGLAENPRDIELAGNLGFALIKAGQPQAAVEVLTQAIILDPRRTTTWAPLGEALTLSGQPEAGIAALWIAYQWSGNREKTVAVFGDRAIKDQETHPDVAALYQSARAWVSENHRPDLTRLLAN